MSGLYNPMSTVNKLPGQWDHPYKGTVVQVDNDPNYVGRIKVDIPELFGDYVETADGSTAGILPWVYPRFFGHFSGKLDFAVPEKGEVVEVIFPYKTPYLPYYTNKPLYDKIWDWLEQDEEGQKIAQKFKTHYPNVYGHIDRNLTGWYVDKVTNEIFLVQGGKKCNITMDSEGSLIANSPKNIIFNAGQSIILNSGESVEVSTQDIAMASTTYDLNSPTMNTTGTHAHTGTITADTEITAKDVTLTGHTHKYVKPAHPGGSDDSEKPTPGT